MKKVTLSSYLVYVCHSDLQILHLLTVILAEKER